LEIEWFFRQLALRSHVLQLSEQRFDICLFLDLLGGFGLAEKTFDLHSSPDAFPFTDSSFSSVLGDNL
jgi:hypothetical protein